MVKDCNTAIYLHVAQLEMCSEPDHAQTSLTSIFKHNHFLAQN